MYTIRALPEFDAWISCLKEDTTRLRFARRLKKAEKGNLGDVKPLGSGVWEMREFFGPGWRMYYVQRGGCLIVMLGGGDKSAQSQDVKRAITLSETLED